MKELKSPAIIILSILVVISLAVNILLFSWISSNNQREVSTQLILSSKIKCLETKDASDCTKAEEVLRTHKENALKFEY